MKAPRKPSKRAERRAQTRATGKDVRDRIRVAALSPGGAAERPLDVASASLVDVHARATPCPVCGGSVRLDEHAAETIDGARLRIARVQCSLCHHRHEIYFRIVSDPRN